MELFAVIMAGGVGSRFWPRSTEKMPKQLIRIFGKKTMIQDTVDRLNGLIDGDHIYIITNRTQKQEIVEQLENVDPENIIAEPFGKNTAACIGLASEIIRKKNENAVIITLPADHFIKDVDEFKHSIKIAAEFAYESKGLITIGINPNRPETGYGYIQIDEKDLKENIFKVLSFAEKPNFDTAKRFIKAGDFMWNSGMFIWRVDTILSEIEKLMPDLHQGLEAIYDCIGKPEFEDTLVNVYGQLKNISIDYGIMEHSDKVYLTKGYFDWSDVGSWEAVYELSGKDEFHNAKIGNVHTLDTYNSYVYSPDKFTAMIGVNNLIVINTDNALLVCDRHNAQDVKLIVDYLKMNHFAELT